MILVSDSSPSPEKFELSVKLEDLKESSDNFMTSFSLNAYPMSKRSSKVEPEPVELVVDPLILDFFLLTNMLSSIN